jgi:pentatricopeptide repeat protein
MALLYASSVHVSIRIREIAAERLFNLEPDNVHNLVTLMKMYVNTGRLEKVEKMMREVHHTCMPGQNQWNIKV